MIFVDTNIIVDCLRNYSPAVDYIESLMENEVLFSAITESELLAGRENNDAQKREALLHFLHGWRKVEVTNAIAVRAGDMSRMCGLDIPDAIIAASALLSNSMLVTRNVKHFQKVKELRIERPYS